MSPKVLRPQTVCARPSTNNCAFRWKKASTFIIGETFLVAGRGIARGGARETHWPACHGNDLLSRTKTRPQKEPGPPMLRRPFSMRVQTLLA